MRVRHPKALHGGEGAAEPSSRWVDGRGSTHYAKGGPPPFVGDKDGNGRKAGLGGQDCCRGGPETVRSPTLDLAPKDLHPREHTLGGDEEVGAIQQNGEEQGVGEAVGQVGGQACPRRGEALDGGKGSLRESEPAGEVG